MGKKLRLSENEFINLINDIVKEETESSDNMTVIKKGQEVLNTEEKKKKFIELCKECIAEFDKKERGFSANMQVEQVLMGVSLFFIAGAVFLDFLVVAVPAGIGLIMLGSEVRQKWMKVIRCARNKRKGITTTDNTTDTVTPDNTTGIPTPEKTIQETKMKKTIRLTETELIKLVQKIIKEDEMMSPEMTESTTLNKLFGLKSGKYGANISGSSPFMVKGKQTNNQWMELKKNIILEPFDEIKSKNCNVEVYPLNSRGMAAGKQMYFYFNESGKAILR